MDKGSLAKALEGKNGHLLIVDCRRFLEYNTSHIKHAINICCSKLVRRRLIDNKMCAIDFLYQHLANTGLEDQEPPQLDVVLYDDSGTIISSSTKGKSPPALSGTCASMALKLNGLIGSSSTGDQRELGRDDCFLTILQRKLSNAHFHSVQSLKGGFLEFQADFPELCESSSSSMSKNSFGSGSGSSGRISLTSLSQPCLPVTAQGPTKILPFLYLGSQQDAMDRDLLRSHGIEYVLNLSITCPKPEFLTEEHFKRISVNDSYTEKLLPHFEEAFQFLDKVRQTNTCVLVHCLAGISRSPTMAIAFVMKHLRMTSEEAYRYVKEKRPSISPNFNFLGQLLEYEKVLNGERDQQLVSPNSSKSGGSKTASPAFEEFCPIGTELKSPRSKGTLETGEASFESMFRSVSCPSVKMQHKTTTFIRQMQPPARLNLRLELSNTAAGSGKRKLELRSPEKKRNVLPRCSSGLRLCDQTVIEVDTPSSAPTSPMETTDVFETPGCDEHENVPPFPPPSRTSEGTTKFKWPAPSGAKAGELPSPSTELSLGFTACDLSGQRAVSTTEAEAHPSSPPDHFFTDSLSSSAEVFHTPGTSKTCQTNPFFAAFRNARLQKKLPDATDDYTPWQHSPTPPPPPPEGSSRLSIPVVKIDEGNTVGGMEIEGGRKRMNLHLPPPLLLKDLCCGQKSVSPTSAQTPSSAGSFVDSSYLSLKSGSNRSSFSSEGPKSADISERDEKETFATPSAVENPLFLKPLAFPTSQGRSGANGSASPGTSLSARAYSSLRENKSCRQQSGSIQGQFGVSDSIHRSDSNLLDSQTGEIYRQGAVFVGSAATYGQTTSGTGGGEGLSNPKHAKRKHQPYAGATSCRQELNRYLNFRRRSYPRKSGVSPRFASARSKSFSSRIHEIVRGAVAHHVPYAGALDFATSALSPLAEPHIAASWLFQTLRSAASSTSTAASRSGDSSTRDGPPPGRGRAKNGPETQGNGTREVAPGAPHSFSAFEFRDWCPIGSLTPPPPKSKSEDVLSQKFYENLSALSDSELDSPESGFVEIIPVSHMRAYARGSLERPERDGESISSNSSLEILVS